MKITNSIGIQTRLSDFPTRAAIHNSIVLPLDYRENRVFFLSWQASNTFPFGVFSTSVMSVLFSTYKICLHYMWWICGMYMHIKCILIHFQIYSHLLCGFSLGALAIGNHFASFSLSSIFLSNQAKPNHIMQINNQHQITDRCSVNLEKFCWIRR